MKKELTLLAAGAWLCGACSLFELDNYDAPAETIQGEVVDAATGEAVPADKGGEGIRVRLTEVSWDAEHRQPNPDFWCMMDGTFQNTKIFKGKYDICIYGPFIPLYREDASRNPLADEFDEQGLRGVEISGVKKVTVRVQPFLKVELLDAQCSYGKITARVRISRAVTEQEFESKVKPTMNSSDWNAALLNLKEVYLFVSYSPFVGYRARDERWSVKWDQAADLNRVAFGQEFEITSAGTIPSGRTVFIRAAARINYNYENALMPSNCYNYSQPMEQIVP
jgi:hypothetical protein